MWSARDADALYWVTDIRIDAPPVSPCHALVTRGETYSFAACISRMAIDPAYLTRRKGGMRYKHISQGERGHYFTKRGAPFRSRLSDTRYACG